MIIAGPNGSGKTTLTHRLRDTGFDLGEYINADDIAAGLAGAPGDVSREAQRLAEEARQSCLANGVSFSFETVMSHASKIDLLNQAKTLGYYVLLFFVGVDDPRINIDRVAQRVSLGGHDVPIDRIVRRYERTMSLLPAAIRAADRSVLFDNSHSDHGGGASLVPIVEVIRDPDGELELAVLSGEGAPELLPNWAARPLLKAVPFHWEWKRSQ